MTLAEQIAAKLAVLNSPDQVQGRSGVRWGYDPQRMAWFTEGDRLAREAGGRYYQNTTMGLPESVAREGRTVSADGNVMDPGQGGGVLHGNQVWDNRTGQFVTPFSWDKLGFYGTLAALTGGAANAFMAGGAPAAAATGATGATGAAGGALPAATVPGWSTVGMAGGVTAPAMTPINAAIAGTRAVPGATGLPTATSGVGTGQNILDRLRSGGGAEALATLIPMLMAARTQTNSPITGGPTLDSINKLIGMSTERAQRTDPLHQAVTQLAMSRMPTGVQR